MNRIPTYPSGTGEPDTPPASPNGFSMPKARLREPGISRAIWIPVIWLMIMGSRNISAWFDDPDSVDITDLAMEGSPLDRNIFLALILIGVIVLWRRRIDWGRVLRTNSWVFLLFLYAAVSIVWSDFPFVSLKRWIKGTGNIVMVLIVFTDPMPLEAFKALIRRVGYVLIPASVVLILFFPTLGSVTDPQLGETAFTGVTTQKNSLGYDCLVFGLFYFWLILTNRHSKGKGSKGKNYLIPGLMLLMIAFLFFKARSATAASCFLLGVTVMLATKEPRRDERGNRLFNGLVLVGIFAALILPLAGDPIEFLLKSMGREVTLTGRTDLWKSLLDAGTNPVIGTGYESFWLGKKAEKIWEIFIWMPNQAHNGYLEMYLNLGIFGLFLLGLAFVSAFLDINRTFKTDYEWGRFRIAFFLIVLFYNVAEAAFLKNHLVWLMFLFITIGSPAYSLLRPAPVRKRVPRIPSR